MRPEDEKPTVTEPASPGAVDSSARLAPGAAIGRYVVIDRLGAGAMGVVYDAYDPEMDRRVAIKLVRSHRGPIAAGDSELRLLREAQALARVSHPNVVAVHDVGKLGDQVFLAMELVQGVTLRRWLEPGRPWREVLEALLAAGRGLAAAHEAGVLHRDFKPDNVLVGTDGRPRVVDFGLARGIGGAGDDAEPEAAPRVDALASRLTRLGAVMGTPGFMAPELFDGAPASHLTDQFAFCAALYEGLFKQPAVSLGDKGRPIAIVDPPAGDVPRRVRRAVMRGLSLDPRARFRSMSALLRALARATQSSWGLAAAAFAVMAVVAGVLAPIALAEDPCADARGLGDRVRSAARGDRSHAAFRRIVEASASELDVMDRRACEAARVHGARSNEHYRAQRACLALHARELELILVASDEQGAVDALLTLPEPGLCEVAPWSPAGERAFEAVARARAAAELGRGAEALEAAKSLEPSLARERAEAMLAAGMALARTSDAGAVTAAEEALWAARQTADARRVGEASLLLSAILAASDSARARAHLAEARAALRREEEPMLGARLALVECSLAEDAAGAGSLDRARAAIAGLPSSRVDRRPLAAAAMLESLSALELRHGDAEGALEHASRARGLRETWQGPGHRDVARADQLIRAATERRAQAADAER